MDARLPSSRLTSFSTPRGAMLPLLVLPLLLVGLLGLRPVAPGAASATTSQAISDTLTRTFDVSPGGMLRLSGQMANVRVRPGNSNTVTVRAIIEDRASDWYTVSFAQEGNTVQVEGERRASGWFSSWFGSSSRSAVFVVEVPAVFDVDLATSSGRIDVADLTGQVATRSSSGSQSIGTIDGTVDARASSGRLRIGGATQEVNARTSSGSMEIGAVGGPVSVRSSSGRITLEGVAGAIDARASSGSITASLTAQPAEDSQIRASSGSVRVYLPSDVNLDIQAQASSGRVRIDLPLLVEGEQGRNRLQGTLNAGGPRLSIQTSSGSIRLLPLADASPSAGRS